MTDRGRPGGRPSNAPPDIYSGAGAISTAKGVRE